MNQALIKHFKLSESDVAQMQASLQPHQSILEVLLEKKLIDPAAYLAWAKEHYSLPVLKIEFLNKTNNIENLLDRYKNVFPKNVIPFHEMDGILYVMCLEPTPFEAPQTIQYVLAPFDILQKYAFKNESSVVHQESIEMPVEKENTNPLFKNLEASKGASPLDSFSFENISIGEAKPAEEPPPGSEDQGEIKLEDKADVPAGLNFPSSPSGADNSFVSENPVTSVDLNSFKFEGLMPVVDHPVPAKEEEKSVQPAAPSQPTPVPVAAPVATPVAAPVKAAPSKVSVLTADSLIAKHPPKNKPQTQPAETAAPVAAAPTAIPMPQPAPIAPPQAAPVAPPTPVMAPPPPSPVVPVHASVPTPAAPQSAEFDGILHALKKYFDQTMVLLFTNGNLEPKAWDATWTKSAHAQNMIDVTTPSIFRIVNETQHPYHGHIIPNSVNESFFNNWNKGQYPEHITICPIIHEKKIYGMVLGATTKEGAKKYQLHHVQEIANDTFAMLSSSKAA